MNQTKPVQLSQKIQFLHQKIDFVNEQVKKSGLFQLKMKFIQYIDTSIQKICNIDGKNNYSSQIIKRKYQQYYNSQQNERQKNRIQKQKIELAQRLSNLKQKQRNIEIQALKIELQNSRILKQKMNKQYSTKQIQLKTYLYQMQKKLKSIQKQLQKVVSLNSAQARQIQHLKQQRNRAQKRQNQWRQKYDNQIGVLQTFKNKKSKYVFRDQQGLKIYRTITNSTNTIKGCQRLILCDLPLKFHVFKIVYGIKVGQMLLNRQIEYFKQISLYQKEEMILSIESGYLTVQYIKRKVYLKLDKYQIINKNQIIIMLFGKGDAISIDQTT